MGTLSYFLAVLYVMIVSDPCLTKVIAARIFYLELGEERS